MHPTTPLIWIRTTAVCLILAPLLQAAATVISISLQPSGDMAGPLDAIAVHETALVISTLVGLAATILYVPAFVGLAHNVAMRSPILSLVAAFFSICSMVGFAGLQGLQAIHLGDAQSASNRDVPLIDGGNPITAGMLLLFQVGTFVGMITLIIAVWRSGRFPKAPLILLAAELVFGVVAQLVFVAGGGLGASLVPIIANLVFLAGLGWLGLVLWRQPRDFSDELETSIEGEEVDSTASLSS